MKKYIKWNENINITYQNLQDAAQVVHKERFIPLPSFITIEV